MKSLFVFPIILALTLQLSAQEVKIPTNYQLKAVEDYAPYKDSVKLVGNWLINTPLNQDIINRASAKKFMFTWVSGAPYTHIEIKPEFTMEVMNDQSNSYANDLLMNYIAGMTLVKIDDKDAEEVVAQEAGVNAMLAGYKTIRKESKNKFLEKLLKLEKKGELSEWIKNTNVEYEQKDKAKVIPKD